ncbi:cyclin-H1-1-like isoform X1 [Cicer arietinum]|uniref:cyclin-H1-1-like isoform X1 n=2 Tax=Cicer arietinum TaxID=3827 RepID=UPI003CC59CD1
MHCVVFEEVYTDLTFSQLEESTSVCPHLFCGKSTTLGFLIGMADFLTSTHRAKWIFSPQQLVEKYTAANQRAKQILEKGGVTLMEVDVDGSLSYPEPQTTASDNAEKHSQIKPVSIEEEQCIKVFYENKLQEVCNNLHFPHKIQATALIFFKRFYLRWSVMEHQPNNLMLTCIYAACKIEENLVSAEELGKRVSQDHEIVLCNEMIVYQSLEFELIVYTPYRSVEGFNYMEELCNAGEDKRQALQNTARLEVDKMMLTDAPLLFPPGQLALAALRNSNALHQVVDFDSFLSRVFSHQNSTHTMAELLESLDAIDSLVRKYRSPSEKELEHINGKLKSCWGL